MKTLKKGVIEDSVLKYPDFIKPFILYTDASGGGLGAGAQVRYSASELEFMAMHWAIMKQYKQYLLRKSFTLITDRSSSS